MPKNSDSEASREQVRNEPVLMSAEEPIPLAEPDARIEDLERRIAEIGQRLAVSSTTPSAAAGATTLSEQNEKIGELQRLVGTLGEQVMAAQAIREREERFNAAVRSVEVAAAAVQRGLTTSPVHEETSDTCQDGPCSCTASDCCTFEVWMSHVRVDHMQIEPADSNVTPTAILEVWMFASIDPIYNIGVCIPDPSPLSGLLLHKQLTDPYGPWVPVNRCIGTATVRKNTPLTVPLAVFAVDRETALERVKPANRDEWGSHTVDVTLDCCFTGYSPIEVHVPLTSWGQGGGAITGKFIVIKRS